MDYQAYLLAEWNGFLDDPSRARATLAAVAERRVEHVLDVGCGAGQELIPFAQDGAFCVGLDLSPMLGRAPWEPKHGHVTFVRGNGERLPFRDGVFDVLVCRGALPHMNNHTALCEMARVLRPGGLLLLKLVSASFYWREVRRGVAGRDPRRCVHAVHALVGGAVYHALGTQVRTPVTRVAFQSKRMLHRELRRVGMRIIRRMPDDAPIGPSFAIEKSTSA
jgi:ubiquinone/menaquinone biosynthesis C-methylase UbiE